MPELPEVETTLRGITPHILGKKLLSVSVTQPRLRWPVPVEKIQALKGSVVTDLKRRGKYILMCFGDQQLLLWHLGMSGSLRICGEDNMPKKHDHVSLAFSDNINLLFHDPRRFGCLLWADEEMHPLISHLGPEPLSDEFNGCYLKKQSENRHVAVKNFIMNSKVVVGVGNIYASEALFLSGIHPRRKVNLISLKRYDRLSEAVKVVLAEAIQMGGSTLNDFLDPQGVPGYFTQKLNVYGREGKRCKQCKTGIIRRVLLAQRSSFYCAVCQH